MSGRTAPPGAKALVYIPYALAMLVILFIFGRYVLRLGDPPGPPAQGAEIASLRGFGMFILDHPLDSTTREQIGVFSDGGIARWVLIDGVEKRTNDAPIRPALLEAARQFQQTWCAQTVLSPTPTPTVETYRLYLSCTTWTGRIFYFAADQLPLVLVDVLREAPPLHTP
ncbi:MAG: hypothetical protein HGA19_24875 [Oscillochloris sp.]|nr:hypothetical protein [Oscillochloris sp.]